MAYFKLISRTSGNVTAYFELEIAGDVELDYLNSFKKDSLVKQIGYPEYERLKSEREEKNYFFDGRP